MSSTIQHKLSGLEVTPPPGVWEKIAAELNDSELEHKFPSTLYEMTIPAPAGVWSKIEAQLDAPVTTDTVAAKLLALEVTPPATTWNKINTSLDAEHEAAIPEHRRLSPLLRYGAAAAIVGLLIWGGISLLNNNKSTTDIVAGKEQPSIPTAIPTQETTPEVAIDDEQLTANPIAVEEPDEARNDAALEASKKTYARLDMTATSKIKEAANFYFSEPLQSGNVRGFAISDPVPDFSAADNNTANRYIVLMTPDGNIIRMSKKLSNLVCCVSGEEQDEDCKDQMKKWRDQIASPAATHSPGNVLDILSLVNSLQGDNDL
jgi:hypothetical protein